MSRFEEREDALVAEFVFADFAEAWRFMNAVAAEAEAMDHHPDWRNVYNRVEIRLSTHSAGNKVTQLDRELAQRIATLYQRLSTPS